MSLLNVKLFNEFIRENSNQKPIEPSVDLTKFEVGQRIDGMYFDTSRQIDFTNFVPTNPDWTELIQADTDEGKSMNGAFIVVPIENINSSIESGYCIALFEEQKIVYSEKAFNSDFGDIPQGWNMPLIGDDGLVKLSKAYNIREVANIDNWEWNGVFVGVKLTEQQPQPPEPPQPSDKQTPFEYADIVAGLDFGSNAVNGGISEEMEKFLTSLPYSDYACDILDLIDYSHSSEPIKLMAMSIGGETVLALLYNEDDEQHFIYNCTDGEFGTRGWHNLTNGKISLNATSQMQVTKIHDVGMEWNGTLIGATQDYYPPEQEEPEFVEPIDISLNNHAYVNANDSKEYDTMAKVRFTPTETAEYTLKSIGMSNTRCYLYSSKGDQITSAYGDYDNNNFMLTYQLEAYVTYIYAVSFMDYGTTGEMQLLLTKEEPKPEPDEPSNKFEPIKEKDYIYEFIFDESLGIDEMRKLCENIIPSSSDTHSEIMLIQYEYQSDSSIGTIDLIYNKDSDYYWIRKQSKSYGETVIWASDFSATGTVGWQNLKDGVLTLGDYVTITSVNLNDEWNGKVIGKK